MVAGGVSAALWPDAEKFASVHHQGLMAHGLQPAAAVLCCTWLMSVLSCRAFKNIEKGQQV
jgi:hypothetical protein